MAAVNKVILVGNLGKDPEVRYSANGGAICNVRLATTRNWKDKNTGEKKEETEWHSVVFYDRLAEIAGEYLKKGRPLFVEGRLQLDTWDDKQTGQKRSKMRVVCENFQMLGSRDGGAEGGGGGGRSSGGGSRPAKSAPAAEEPSDDDIPF